MTIELEDPDLMTQAANAAAIVGVSLPDFIAIAVRDRLYRMRGGTPRPVDEESVRRLQRVIADATVLDDRHPDDMLYDKHGLSR